MLHPDPLPIGTPYDGSHVVAVLDCDFHDDYQPHLYALEDGRSVWIPAVPREDKPCA